MDNKQKILIVDDKMSNLLTLESTLKETGAELVLATSGQEALAALLKNKVALAILDIQMPDMDGFELAELLRGDPNTKTLPIIFLTAVYSSSDHVFRGYETGAVDYMVKPYEPHILISKVKVLLELDSSKEELKRHRDTLELMVAKRTVQYKEAADKYSSLIESIGEITYEYDIANDQITYKGKHFQETLGFTEQEIGHTIAEWERHVHPEDTIKISQEFKRALKDKDKFSVEYRFKQKQGGYIWLHEFAKVRVDDSGEPFQLVGIVKNIDENKKHEENIKLNASVIEYSNDGVIITDTENRIISVNPAFTKITGYDPEDVLGKIPSILSSGLHNDEFYRQMWNQLEEHGFWAGEILNKRKNGDTYPEWLSIISIHDKNDKLINHVGIFSDLSDITQFKERLQYLAFYDPLTNLPNRSLLNDRLRSSISLAKREDEKLAIIFIDLDRFKNINDTLGHSVGDKLLQFVASKLSECIRDSDILARFGGDEFVIVLHSINSSADAKLVADKILLILENFPFVYEEHEMFINCSIGISLYPENGTNTEELISAADTAMYRSKHNGGRCFHLYLDEMSENFLELLSMENDLRHALDNDDLYLLYQPQIDITNNKIIGCEALIRWNHPTQGLISPGKFIPLAEDTGLIGIIGEYVMRTAILQAKKWYEEGFKDLRIAINVSSMQLRSPDINHLLAQVSSHASDNSCQIELEITESTLMKQADEILRILQIMRNNGVLISIDDFGTGYSSLNYLKQLPIDKLKVDQSFVRNIAKDKDDAAIVATIISMAKNLGLNVIAEGVETMEQLEYLSGHECREAQGFLFSKPIPPEDISQIMSDGGFLHPEGDV